MDATAAEESHPDDARPSPGTASPSPGKQLQKRKGTQQVAIRNAITSHGEKRSLNVNDGNSTREEKQENQSQKLPFEQVISYNIDEGERPDGIRVRFKVRIATGKKAAALDARLAEAMREILLWTRDHAPWQEPRSR